MTSPNGGATATDLGDIFSLMESVRNATAAKDEAEQKLSSTELQLEATKSTLTAEREYHAADVKLIGDTFLSELIDREEESAYDSVVDSVNYRLRFQLPERERTYRVAVPVTVIFRVTASSSSEAEELISEDLSAIESTIDGTDPSSGGSVVSEVDRFSIETEVDDDY
jgi:hypothetical protein